MQGADPPLFFTLQTLLSRFDKKKYVGSRKSKQNVYRVEDDRDANDSG
jgi:hypothetical protein